MKKITLLLLLVSSQWLYAQVTANTPNPLIACDINNDGFATFDLTDADADIIGSQTNVQVTYHLTITDADNGVNPQTPFNFANSVQYAQIVYARVEDIFTGDYATTQLELIVELLPATTTPNPIVLVDTNGDGFEIFDLTIRENDIIPPSPDINFYYFETLTDATSGTNAIANPSAYQNIVSPVQTIYVWVGDINTGCFAIEPMDIVVDTVPSVPTALQDDYVVFDDDGDGVAIFDLTFLIPQIIGTQTGLEVTFYETEVDALNKTNAVSDPEAYENISNPQTMYARTETVYGTFALTSFTIFADENLSSREFDAGYVNIYPNPAKGFIYINIEGINEDYGIEIISVNGQVVLTTMETSQTAMLDVSGLNSGIYFLKIISTNKQITKKLIKQ